MSIFREFNISMIPGKPPLIIHVSQYESDFVYTFHLVSGKNVLAIPDTAIAVIRGTKRDGNGYSVEAALDAENHKVVVMGDPQLTACAGRNVFELAIINDEKVICTANFFLDVERAPLDSDTIQSETVLHDLQAIIDSAATATQAAQEASASAESAASAAEQAVEEKFEDGVAETIDEWLTNHPEATTTVQDGSVTKAKLTNDLINVLSNPKFITLEELPNATNGVYTLGTVTINDAIQLQRQNNRGIIIVDTVFNINTSVLFPAFSATSYFILPSFVGCVFNNLTNNRALITSGSTNTVASKITGCNFNNVDMVADSDYVQDFNFTNCYIASYDTFLDCPNNTVQARFVNCSVESESNKLVNALKFSGYFSGTYEGNSGQDFYFVNCKYCVLEFNSCWFESCKMLHVDGGTLVKERSIINVNSCEILGEGSSEKFVLKVENPTYVSLFINGSHFAPYSANSRFTDATPNSFEQIKGKFMLSTADTYCNPIGGVSAQNKEYATIEDVNSLKPIYYKLLLSQTVIDGGGITYDLPVGQYLMIAGVGSYSVLSVAMICLLGASIESSTHVGYSKIVDAPAGSYLQNLNVTLSKQNATDKTFTVNFNATSPQTYFITLIKLY